MLQHDDSNKTELLYCSPINEKDILLRNELDELAEKYSDQFKVRYNVDKAGEGWAYRFGFVNNMMIKVHFFPADDSTITLICGPPPMIHFSCNPALDKLTGLLSS